MAAGEAASRLVMEAGPSTATSLAELANIRPGFEGVGQSWVQLLSHQTSLGHPTPLAALMLQRTLPQTHLTSAEVRISTGMSKIQLPSPS